MRCRNDLSVQGICNTEKEDNKKYQSANDSPLYRWLDPRNPARARRHIGDIYWNGWRSFVLGFFLSAVGLTFIALGVGLCLLTVDVSRGVALFIVGCLLTIPGVFSLMVLWYYVCGVDGYSYSQLLDN
ncbi:Protein of unknown function DUF872 [Trypanosoma melophagium]|uniref:Protein of unknown function DUF872 n=1 Tax=Trypanosoma melophagium TaxID=715481 RepID=UPI00351A5C4C|nr:Protein of unknown function DUF872 [Trypanosoma melophagium]